MKIKVCGINTLENLKAIDALGVDHIGYNFYPKSARYLDESTKLNDYQTTAEKVGVFVQEEIDRVKQLIDLHELDHVQLHGDESLSYCKALARNINVVKVFRVDEDFDFSIVEPYEFCDFYLFDTKVKEYGGSGRKFDWDMLNQYVGNVPFMLSGGIGPDDVERLQTFSHPMFYGIDINSKFEISPGLKDVAMIKSFLKKLTKN